MRVIVCDSYDQCEDAVRHNDADICLVECENKGVTYLYLLHGKEVPAVVRELPGFRFSASSGLPAAWVESYSCYRTVDEVMLALSQI